MTLPLCVPVFVPQTIWDTETRETDDGLATGAHRTRLKYSQRTKLRQIGMAGLLTTVLLVLITLAERGNDAGLFDLSGGRGTEHDGPTTKKDSIPSKYRNRMSAKSNGRPSVDTEGSSAVCRKVPLFVDLERNSKRKGTPRPLISIIFITKRPGSYDILLHSLAQQQEANPGDYELISVDEIASMRAAKIYALADRLKVPLVALLPSKPKARANANLRHGIYNAVNTGLLMARGKFVTFVMDLSWIPSNYLKRTKAFYSNPRHKKSLLGYPELFFSYRKQLDKKRITDQRSITFWAEEQTEPFSKQRELFHPGGSRPEDMVQAFLAGSPLGLERQPREDITGGFKFWELSFASAPWAILEELNGVEERFDYGDDCHEANIQLRSEFLGADLWIDGNVIVENLHHKGAFQQAKEGEVVSDMWNRYSKDTIQDKVIIQMPGEIQRGERSVRSFGHDFNLTEWRLHDCAANL